MRYEQNKDVILINLGEQLLISIGENKVVQLSGTGKTVFEAALKAEKIDDIVLAIRTKYQVDISDEELKVDINECLDMLIENGIIFDKN